MKKQVSITLLCLSLLIVTSLHVDLKHEENGLLLVVDEYPIDVVGITQNQWNKLTRNCDSVQKLSSDQATYKLAKKLIQSYSPPSSESAQIASAWSIDGWIMAEVEFNELFPAVVLIKNTGDDAYIVPQALWSGYTKPWKAAPYIRQYLARQAKEMPATLLKCFEPVSQSFR
ncbi:MAG: hypothetical protein EBR27_01720 [Betaproteobacteria bacterium]|nr:hypothetical protein [Betaproteobacteria bacterium]